MVVKNTCTYIARHAFVFVFIVLSHFLASCLLAIQSRPEFEFVVLRIGSAVGNKSGAALLRARALLTATKLSNFLFEKYPYDMDKLLLISAEALHKDEPPPVRVSALKAFSVFLSKCPCDVR